jgi:hypothetical protein
MFPAKSVTPVSHVPTGKALGRLGNVLNLGTAELRCAGFYKQDVRWGDPGVPPEPENQSTSFLNVLIYYKSFEANAYLIASKR